MVAEDERRGRQGRRFVSAERRRELLTAYGTSGLTRTEFARREGVRYTTFCAWAQQEAKASGRAPAAPTVRFAEVALPSGAAHGLEVRLPDGTTLRGERVEELAALARALRG